MAEFWTCYLFIGVMIYMFGRNAAKHLIPKEFFTGLIVEILSCAYVAVAWLPAILAKSIKG